VQTDPDHVLVCNGFAQGLALIARTLTRLDGRQIAVEDPGHVGQVAVLRNAGATVASARVDDHGLDVVDLAATGARAVVITAAHQFPLGVALAPERRVDLLAWARRGHRRRLRRRVPLRPPTRRSPATHGPRPHGGSVSKTLAPSLRLGWLVLPGWLRTPVIEEKAGTDLATATIDQLALADFLAEGHYDRHLRRVRRRYRERRAALVAAVQRHLPGCTLARLPAGLHATLRLPPGISEHHLAEQANSRGIGVYPLSDYARKPGQQQAAALVLGYANLTPERIHQGIERFGACLRQRQRSR
jgi:GntR family transcriptional regulator/MocR family aminotransferase